MKGIQNQNFLPNLINKCLENDRLAQQELYVQFKDKMFVLCLRYANSREDAEDILQDGFIKVFRDLKQYNGSGCFEGWVRKVMVNVALEHIRKEKKKPFQTVLEQIEFKASEETSFFEKENQAKALIQLMRKMPIGFRTVLNLYILEGYTHPEISAILGISVGTSKSQLLRAKGCLRKLLKDSLVA